MPSANDPDAVTTMVCVTCGNEEFFADAVPARLTCAKCGGTVFREFLTPTQRDDATISQLEAQARSMAYGDSSPQSTADDVRDLGSR